ncbi:MAG TPA: antibiotic biosynthesis monooxygenase [Acidothermaceae bacterium]|jgi:quinol monooxygenase YgiN|nr:antibiotic biosynthesis monooxygenase [Acidothermaceae bacterium]
MTVKLGLLALLEAKPEKGRELAAFLEGGRSIAAAEEGTVTWYAFKISDTSYGIFDTFESEDARDAHLNGEIPRALAQVGADLLARAPEIRTVDVIAVK